MGLFNCASDSWLSMNILYTLTAYPPAMGGAQLHTHALVKELKKQLHTQVITLWDKNRTDWLLGTTLRVPEEGLDYEFEGVPIHRIGLSRQEKLSIAPYVPIYYPFMDMAIKPLSARIQQHINPYAAQSDLIHNVRIGREPLSYASLQAARQYDIPFILTPLHHPRWVGWRYRAYHKLYRMSDALIALTNSEKRTLIESGVREEKIYVTGVGPIITSQAHPEYFLTTNSIDGPIVLFLGQHYPYKGYKQILEAARFVWKKIPEVHFVFIGPTVGNSELEFLAFSDRRVHRLVSVDQQVKTDALAACALLCVPSTQESFGGIYTEAWWFEKPVIGCPIPAVSEVISDGIDGYLVEQNANQIAEAICHLLLNPELMQKMGRAGQRKVNERYTWENLASKTRAIYQKMCQN
jgi:glycosyltransferase involved in cell wall biosynthesis